MAVFKYARAAVVNPFVTDSGWSDVLSGSMVSGPGFGNRVASVFHKFDPGSYLLSHATIMASVDVENGPGVLGNHMVEGFQVTRKFPDFYITPGTSKYVNNNGDAWSRATLLSTFRTFIGAQNYCEHLQIPELSKGRIVDAAARDLGDTVYIDILVATDRKHEPLVQAIESGEIRAMSMGCKVKYTICSKCGNVAEDETQACKHVRYQKRNTFVDDRGITRIIAELCGHHSDPESVEFIEASWVGHPAFTGAVVRNFLTVSDMSQLGPKIQAILSSPARNIADGQMARAAAQQFDFNSPEPQSESTPAQDSAVDKAVGEMADYIREKALEKVRGELAKDIPPRSDLDEDRNDTLIRSSFVKKASVLLQSVKSESSRKKLAQGLNLYRVGGWRSVQASGGFGGVDILALSRMLDQINNVPRIAGEYRVYRTVLAVGGYAPYADENSYLAACRRVIGREITGSEKDALLAKGRLYDLGTSKS